jgi:predicted Zn-dependent protease
MTLGLTSRRAGSFRTSNAPRNPSPNSNAPSPWTRPSRTPTAAWASTTALGQFDQSLEVLDNAIRASPSDPALTYYYGNKTWANFGLKRYDEAIELARRALAINPYNPYANVVLVAGLALTDHDAEAREALQRYLPPSAASFKTVASRKAHLMSLAPKQGVDLRFVEMSERSYDGLHKAGMPEE